MSAGIMIAHTKGKTFSSDCEKSSKVFADNLSGNKSGRSEGNNDVDISNCGMSLMEMGKCLLKCARESDVDGVKKALYYGAPFSCDWLGMTPLHFAVINNQYEICNMLLANGINKDAKTKVDRTSLHFACFYGHLRIVELLLFYKCAVSPRDMLRMTPLHWAVEKGFKPIVRLLLQHNADVMGISKFGRSPIGLAVLTEQADILEELQIAKQKQISRALQEEVDLAVKHIDISIKNPVKKITNRSNVVAVVTNTSTVPMSTVTDKSTELRLKCKTHKMPIQKEQKLALATPIIDNSLHLNQKESENVCFRQNNTKVDNAAFKLNSNSDDINVMPDSDFHSNKTNMFKTSNKTPLKKKDFRLLSVDDSSITNTITNKAPDFSIILSQPVTTINSIPLYKMGLVKTEPMETDVDRSNNQAGLNQQIVEQDVDISQIAHEVEVETALEVEIKTEPMEVIMSTDQKANHIIKEKQNTLHFDDNVDCEVNTNTPRSSPLSICNKRDESMLHNFDQILKEVKGQSQQNSEVLQNRHKRWKQNVTQNIQRDQNKCNHNNANQQLSYNRKRIVRIMPGSIDQVKRSSCTVIESYPTTKFTIRNSGNDSNTAFSSAVNTITVLPKTVSSGTISTDLVPLNIAENAIGSTMTTTKAPTILPTLSSKTVSTFDDLATSIIAPITTLPIAEPIVTSIVSSINSITTMSTTLTATTTKTIAIDTSTINSISLPFANTTSTVPLLTTSEICRQLLELRQQNEELRQKVDILLQEKEQITHRVNQLESSFCLHQ